ncbi:hypothetical protein [Sinomicrobium weinanense]|uniref:Uncharacterized protein n=1 Tax=Sinomicrobium weinanense TaxID=2842200 RepID=A0A926JNX7_9FLAO|nr:hypothetical protein [Sinomicrobium weinanense]MBC9794790.1 hypothetical protein [Sinomicrobium weinanense]MBU3125049.1 hypothetical protein [Sinomicrobium weinanense]
MSTDAILWHTLSEVLNSSEDTVKDPVKNVYYNEVNEFDHINSFQFLDPLNLPGGTINTVNIQNAASLYAIMILGDEMGIFRIADTVLKYVTMGKVDVESTTTATRLYNYMQLRDDRTSFEERTMWYKQVFNIGGGDTVSDMAVNENFLPLWETLMNEVIKYIGKYESAEDPLRVSKSGIRQVVTDLQHNLSRAAAGMVKIFIPEMYAHLEDAIQIINAEELRDQLGHGISRDLWNVVESVSMEEFNYFPNTSALRTIADTARNIILDIATYNQASFSEEQFQKLVRNVDRFIIAQNQLQGSTLSEEEETPEDIEDEMESMEENWDF